jgi:hypothetical protein
MRKFPIRKFTIRTYHDRHLAAAIQEKLFELGYQWEVGEANLVQRTYATAYRVGYQDECTIKWAGIACPWDWDNCIALEKLFQMQPDPRETIKVGTQTYDKADFEAATKHLTPIK